MRKLCPCLGLARSYWVARAILIVFAALTVEVRCECRLGVLKPASNWTVTYRHIVYSIVPDIIPPQDKTTQSRAPTRPSEAVIYAELRPAVPPSKQGRVCLRSASTVVSACSTGKSILAADPPKPTDPGSFIFNTTEGVPLGPCLELNSGSTAADLKQERPRPEECWPGAMYCSDSSTNWKLTQNQTAAGKQLIWLTIVRTLNTYQDTDGRTDLMTTTIPFELTQGCVFPGLTSKLKGAASKAASSPTVSCLACSNQQVSVQSISSSTCIHCPIATSKPRGVMSTVAGSNDWKCIPGMPKGFETITVRMGPGGNPQCASTNGKTCLRNIGNAKTCQAIAAILNGAAKSSTTRQTSGPTHNRITAESGVPVLKPLTCGAAHAAVWPKVTGYNVPGHWCTVSREWLQDRQAVVQGSCEMQA